ncbi:MAG: zinc carboxypeptidase, partial [Bacteroidota bacterium]
MLLQPEPALGDSLTYDVTAWALPYVYGLTGMALDSPLATRSPTPTEVAAPEARRPYAYVARWDGPGDAAFLARLLREGVGVRVVPVPFEASGEAFGRGSLLITRAGNARLGARFDSTVARVARDEQRSLTALQSGFIADGIDAGSNQVGFLRAPRVAVLADSPVSSTALGEIWSLFDQTWTYPLTLLGAPAFDTADLDDHDVLILPDGGYGSWLTDARASSLRDWVRAGGRILALERAALALGRKDGYGLTARDAPEADSSAEARLRRYADRARDRASGANPGAVFRVALDDSHPLAYGYPDWMYVLKRRTASVDYLARGWNVGALRSGEPVAGFTGTEAQARLEDSLVFGVENMGRGHVIYLLDSPIFRGFWRDGELLI